MTSSAFHPNVNAPSSSTAESRQNVLIRNAIASDSQRIRVQDESTGKSYELHLGKGAPYPKRYGGDDPEDYSFEQESPTSPHRLAPPLASSKGRLPRTTTGNGHPPPASNATASSSSHRVLRLPMIVRHRGNAQALPNSTAPRTSNEATQTTTSGDANGSDAQPELSPSTKVPPSPSSPLPTRRSRSGSQKSTEASDLASSPGDAHLKELNKRYHESLAATASSDIARHNSADSNGVTSGANLLNGHANSSAVRLSPRKSSSQQPLTAPTRHYPIMSELPPSPPLEEEDGDRTRRLANNTDTKLQRPQAAQQNPGSQLTIDTAAPARRKYSRQTSAASTSTAYMSAEEGVWSPEGDDDEPATPKATAPKMRILRHSPEPMETSPQRVQEGGNDAETTAAPLAAPPLQRTISSTSSEGKPSRANTTYNGRHYLHPASALPNGPSSPSRRAKRGDAAIRQQPSRRNTTGSSTGSASESVPQQSGTAESGRRGPEGRSFSRGAGPSSSPAGQTSFLDSPIGIPASTSAPGVRALRTGDAGFDEELAKAEANVRKRIERQRRDEEEKALAAQQAEKSEALERTQLQREREKGRERERAAGGGGGGGGLPALMRAKSNLTKLGGGQTGGQSQAQRAAGAAGGDEEKPMVVGNIINESHVNYVMMYNMLTGIRIGVSRCQAKVKRPLVDEDYKARHKFTFDIIGNELTPSAKYDFKFKDYAPWVFRELREYFHLDPADYLLSLTAKYILSELGSPGKSGSFFYFSRDYRFIIKTIRHSEHKFLLRILKDYHEHVKANPHTLLSRFYGLHRVKLPQGRKIHFVIMNNLFPPHRDIHETYDLKGSSYGREYPEEKAKTKKGATLKDINWIRRRRELELGPEKKALFAAQLASDVALLKKLRIMDYSLLIGLHDMRRGNSENLRQEKLQIVQPEAGTVTSVEVAEEIPRIANGALASPTSASQSGMNASTSTGSGAPVLQRSRPSQRSHSADVAPGRLPRRGSSATVLSEGEYVDAETGLPTAPTSSSLAASVAASNPNGAVVTGQSGKRLSEQNVFALRAAVRRSDPKALGSSSTAHLPAQETSERRHFLFYQDEGGFRSTDDNNEPGDWIYYLGIIDLFTPYSSVKRGENWFKRITMDGRTISAVPPNQYGNRFVQFLTAVTRPIKWKDLPPGFDKVGTMESNEKTA